MKVQSRRKDPWKRGGQRTEEGTSWGLSDDQNKEGQWLAEYNNVRFEVNNFREEGKRMVWKQQ